MAVTVGFTVTNAQGQRLAAALGHVASAMDHTWVPATIAEANAWLLRQARQRVRAYEAEAAVAAALASLDTELETW